jgi:hypothetical protein
MTAACLGITCPKRGHCVHYTEVELPEQPPVVRSCRTPEGGYPLFVDRRPVVVAGPVDGEGDSCD